MRTHYDNLKVSMDAPIEVIQAAYRTLAKKYHPDINRDNPEAARIMQIINASYEVLSDPVKRAEHDAWIGKENWRRVVESGKAGSETKHQMPEQQPEPVEAREDTRTIAKGIGRSSIVLLSSFFKLSGRFTVVLVLLLGLVKIFYLTSPKSSTVADVNRVTSTKLPEKAMTTSPALGCAGRQVSFREGKPWPSVAQVMDIHDKRKGLSSLLLDNSRNNQDLFIKLALSQDELTRNSAREVFIPARQQLKLVNVVAGSEVVY